MYFSVEDLVRIIEDAKKLGVTRFEFYHGYDDLSAFCSINETKRVTYQKCPKRFIRMIKEESVEVF